MRTVTSLPTKIQYCQGREGPLLLVQVHCHDQQIIVFCHVHPASWNLPVLPRPKVQYTSCTEEWLPSRLRLLQIDRMAHTVLPVCMYRLILLVNLALIVPIAFIRQYVDVMSLYSYICKYFKFSIGHPIIHVGDACKNKEACLQMEGLIKCSIVPPMNLYPFLPYRRNNKLLFCLCRSCVFERNIFGECKHLRDEERAQTGTWVLN